MKGTYLGQIDDDITWSNNSLRLIKALHVNIDWSTIIDCVLSFV